MKKYIIGFIVGAVVFGSLGVYAATTYLASQITYTKSNNEEITLDTALNELYSLSNASGVGVCKYESNEYGNSSDHLSLGSEYICDVNLDGNTKKNFYVFNVSGDTVTLIAKQNITQGTSKTTYSWMEAMAYVKNLNWKIRADLPKAQDIADAVGNTSWKVENKDYTDWFCFGGNFNQACASNSGTLKNDSNVIKNKWLFNYTRECTNSGCVASTSLGTTEAYGYWTRDIVAQNSDTTYPHRAWDVRRNGGLSYSDVANATNDGVRPTITVLKSNLYE